MDRNGNSMVGIGEGLDAEKDDERRKKRNRLLMKG